MDKELASFLVDTLGKIVLTLGGLGTLYLAFTTFVGWM